jgi:menaquinol-cytochrome c reductase iron-sulfur subunit
MDDAGESRRRWLKRATVAIGGAIGAVIAYPLIRYFLYPLGRRVVSSADGPIDVGPIDAIPAGGAPVRVPVTASSVRDAWALAGESALGAAWLTREGDQVRALSAISPHLGCAVDFDTGKGEFRCPSHTSSFTPDGQRTSGPAKRGLDPLPCEVVDGRVLVTWRRFRTDVPGREPV